MSESSEYSDCSFNELYPLQVLDDSMAPEFPEKCMIVVEPSQACATGAYVVIRVGEERWFRQLIKDDQGCAKLIAVNDAYHEIDLSDKQYMIEGVVVQSNIGRKVTHYKPYLPHNGEELN